MASLSLRAKRRMSAVDLLCKLAAEYYVGDGHVIAVVGGLDDLNASSSVDEFQTRIGRDFVLGPWSDCFLPRT